MSKKRGTLFIFSAPSGAGKTSLIKALVEQCDEIGVSVSYTTRKPRDNEVDGQDYFFVDEAEFNDLIKQNRFLEYANVFGNYYGTPRDWVDEQLATGRNIVLEIDWQGAQQVKSQLRSGVGIFILPPTYQALSDRLVNRQKDDGETVERRMAAACREMSHYKEFDYIVINDDFERALADIRAIVTAVNLEKCRQSPFYDEFVAEIMAQQE